MSSSLGAFEANAVPDNQLAASAEGKETVAKEEDKEERDERAHRVALEDKLELSRCHESGARGKARCLEGFPMVTHFLSEITSKFGRRQLVAVVQCMRLLGKQFEALRTSSKVKVKLKNQKAKVKLEAQKLKKSKKNFRKKFLK